jgi:hypothetical protein
VKGTASTGSAVNGVASSSTGTGVSGQGHFGVVGTGQNSSSSTAVKAIGTNGLLFEGFQPGGVGDVFTVDVNGDTHIDTRGSGGNGLQIDPNSGRTGLIVNASQGTAADIETSVALGLKVVGGCDALFCSGALPVVELDEQDSPTDILEAFNTNTTEVFRLDDGGNVTITGTIKTSGSCHLGCAVTPRLPGNHVVSYSPRESLPTMEDFGEGQLVGGRAFVSLDPAFANVIDSRANYLVFITPEGDNRGLYVTQKSARGFAVRESQGGRSSLAFSYRIVAKPFDSHEARLPMVEVPLRHRGLPTHTRPLHL